MARRRTVQQQQEAAIETTVTISRRQITTFQGRTLGSVSVSSDGLSLIVHRKRLRGGRFDRHIIPMRDVVAYIEGEGGRRGIAYATVFTLTTLFTARGTVDMDADGNGMSVTSQDGDVHIVAPGAYAPDISLSIVEATGDKPLRGEEDDGPIAGDYGDSQDDYEDDADPEDADGDVDDSEYSEDDDVHLDPEDDDPADAEGDWVDDPTPPDPRGRRGRQEPAMKAPAAPPPRPRKPAPAADPEPRRGRAAPAATVATTGRSRPVRSF